MDFEIPEWGNESFSYHYTTSLDQTIIDTAISNAGDKRKKRKKKSNPDETFSPNKKLNQNSLEESKTSIDITQSSKDVNEVAGKVKLSKKKKLKTDLEKQSIIQRRDPLKDGSNEFQNSNSDIIKDNTLIENSSPSKKSKSKKKKKSGKHNKYKELHEKQQTERNKLINPSEKSQHVSTMQKSNSTMAWNISNNIKSEDKTPSPDLPITDSIKSKEKVDIKGNNIKKDKLEKESLIKHDNKKVSEILGSSTTDILDETVSRKPIVKNENTDIKTNKKRKKKKKKLKVDNGEDDDGNNLESDKMGNESEVILNKTKKKKKIARNDSEEEYTKNKRKSVKVSFEHDMEVIEDEDEDNEDSDLKAELERYLGKLKSKTKEELFASESEDEMISDKENESKDEWESLDEDDDEPGDDLESSGDVKKDVDDNVKEINEQKEDILSDMEGENIDNQEDNDVDSEDDNGSNLEEEDENDTDNNEDEIDNEVNEHENDTDSNEEEIESEDDGDENDTDTDEDESEADMDNSEVEDEAKKQLDFNEESFEDNTTTKSLDKNKDGKKKKFDSEKLTALLLESESNKESSKKLSPAEALRQKMSLQLNSARFRLINEHLYTSTGDDAKKMFGNDPEAFQVYHEGYKSQVAKWPINPLDIIIKSLQTKPAELVVADFGCGEAQLSRSVPQKKVFSLDLQAACDGVIVTDMAHTPLKTASVDIAVFCLSLMGTNIKDYVYEANRVLKQEGILKVAEVESRFTGDISTFIKVMEKYGFKCTAKDTSHNFFFLFDFKKTWVPKKSFSLPDISLKPCIYKKR